MGLRASGLGILPEQLQLQADAHVGADQRSGVRRRADLEVGPIQRSVGDEHATALPQPVRGLAEVVEVEATWRVTPWMLRSPTTRWRASPGSTLVLRKVMSGNRS